MSHFSVCLPFRYWIIFSQTENSVFNINNEIKISKYERFEWSREIESSRVRLELSHYHHLPFFRETPYNSFQATWNDPILGFIQADLSQLAIPDLDREFSFWIKNTMEKIICIF